MVDIGDTLNGKEVYEVIELSNSWELAKTENGKSKNDFRVKIVNPEHPQGLTIMHGHFAIDFFGKMCKDEEKALKVLSAIEEVWQRNKVIAVLDKYEQKTKDLPGYPLDYILHAYNWILEQEDINFEGRSEKKQKEIDQVLSRSGVETPKGREGSQLAISLLCDIAEGTHPAEALYRVGLRIRKMF